MDGFFDQAFFAKKREGNPSLTKTYAVEKFLKNKDKGTIDGFFGQAFLFPKKGGKRFL
jgi:hypothetical protein